MDKQDAPRALIEQILTFASQQGLDQAALAAAAGISAETLCRLKKAGRCRLVTALDLAHAAGLQLLSLHAARRRSATIAARKLSAGRRLPVDVTVLVQALKTGVVSREHRVHLLGFFEELPIESVHDVVLDEGLHYERLSTLAHELGAEGETVEWIDEMARYGVA